MPRPTRFHGRINRHGRKAMKMKARALGYKRVGEAMAKPEGFWPRAAYSDRQRMKEDPTE